jgi:hypothetical protein
LQNLKTTVLITYICRKIDRNTALKLANQDIQYDMDTLKDFMGQVGLNLEEVLTRTGDIPKLY